MAHYSMPSQGEASLYQALLPTVTGADSRSLVEETLRFLLSCEASEFGVTGVLGEDEGLLPVKDRRVARGTVIVFSEPEGLQVDGERFCERRMRVGLKLGVGEVGDLRLDSV